MSVPTTNGATIPLESKGKDRLALVTGAGGFIGSHLVEALIMAGWRVRAMTRYTSGGNLGNLRTVIDQSATPDRIELVSADLRDAEAVAECVRGVDTVFHLGAIIAIPYSYRHPDETVAVNVIGTLNVVQAMRRHGTRRGVIVSTSEVYGSALYTPIDEAHPLQPQSPYSASKISAESVALSFYNSYDTPVVVVRPFNTFGPRQSARAVIPTIIAQALTQDEIVLGAIHPYRDYTYAVDTALGLIAAAGSDAAVGKVINLGTGRTERIGNIAAMIVSLIGGHQTVRSGDEQRMRPPKSEVHRLQSNNDKALELLGWRPTYELEDGLRLTIDWVRAHIDQFDPARYVV